MPIIPLKLNNYINLILPLLILSSCYQGNRNALDFQSEKGETFIRIKGENSWGFVNKKGDTVIPLGKYDFLNPIDEKGMILASSNGKSGYINIKQDTLVPFLYDDLSIFSCNRAPALKNGKFGYVNREGKEVIPFKYEEESHFRPTGISEAKLLGKYGFIDTNGDKIIPIEFEKVKSNKIDSIVCAMKNGKWAFYSHLGQQLTEFKYDDIKESNNEKRKKTFFEKGLCLVKSKNKFAYLNKEFVEIIPFGTYDFCTPFRNNLTIVAKKGKYGIIDNTGIEIVPLEYDLIEHPERYYNKSSIFALNKGELFQLLDKDANPITDFDITKYEWYNGRTNKSSRSYFLITKASGLKGTISEKGQTLIPFEYQEIKPFDSESVTYARKDDKYRLIDYNGKAINSMLFDTILSGKFFDYFIVKVSDKMGMIDKKGKEIISFSYERIIPCFYDSNQKFIVRKNGLFGIINKKEEIVVPIEYEAISNWVEYGPEEHFIVKNGKKGLVSREGKIVIPAIYDDIFVDNSTLIKVKNNKLYGTINWDNDIVHPVTYEQILWEWPFITQKPIDTIYIKTNGLYFSTDTLGNILEEKVSKKIIDEKFFYPLNNR